MAHILKHTHNIAPSQNNDTAGSSPHEGGDTSIFEGSLWMVGISLLLFFIPAVNGFIGGLVGGYRIGGVGKALLAAILPAFIVSVCLWVIFTLLQAPVLGLMAGLAVGLLIFLADLGIFVGAAVGGFLNRP